MEDGNDLTAWLPYVEEVDVDLAEALHQAVPIEPWLHASEHMIVYGTSAPQNRHRIQCIEVGPVEGSGCTCRWATMGYQKSSAAGVVDVQ